MSVRTLLVVIAALVASQAQAACERFAVPEGGRVVIVAKDMMMNGVPMSVRELHSGKAPDEIARFYRGEWEGRRQRVQDILEGGWRTLATKDGDCFYTVQIKSDGGQGTYALLGTTVLSTTTARPRGEGFPKMNGSVVYNDMQSNDSGKMGRTLLMKNDYSPRSNAEFYRNSMRADGWLPVSEQSMETLKGQQMVQVWRRGVAEANVVIGQSPGVGGTQVVVNTVDRP